MWRLDEAGWTCRYEPAVEVLHPPRPTWRTWARQRVDYGSSSAPLSARHAGRLAPVRMSGWSAGSWALAAVGHPLAGVVVGAGSAAALVPKLTDVPPKVSLRIAGLGNLHAGTPARRRRAARAVADRADRRAPLATGATYRPGVTAPPPASRPPRRRPRLRRRGVEGRLAGTHHRPPGPELHLLARPLPPRRLTLPRPSRRPPPATSTQIQQFTLTRRPCRRRSNSSTCVHAAARATRAARVMMTPAFRRPCRRKYNS